MLPALESGGVERGTLEVAEALVKAGHTALVMSAGGRMVSELEQIGAEHFVLPIGKKSLLSLRYCLSIRKFLREHSIDVIDVRSRFPAWLIWLTLKTMKKTERPVLITTVHGAYSVSRYSAIMMRGDYIVAVSEFIKGYILQNYPWVDSDKIHVIPRGVSSRDYYPAFKPAQGWYTEWQQQYPQLQKSFVITLVGRISEIKGQDVFIKIIDDLIRQGVGVHGLLVGGVNENKHHLLEALKRDVRSRNLDQIIFFLGHRKDSREIISVSDLLVSLTQKPESFGRTIIEALALGKPVLAYDYGGAHEILSELFPFGLVKPGDNGQFVAKIQQLLATPLQPEKNPYELQVSLQKTLSLYSSCVNKSHHLQ